MRKFVDGVLEQREAYVARLEADMAGELISYHCVFVDETGCEFGKTIEARNKDEARTIAREDYCESRLVQIESPEDTKEREWQTYRDVLDDEYYGQDDYE